MAGGFGGDDEDFDYNDDEELSALDELEEQLAKEQLAEQQLENEDDDEGGDSDESKDDEETLAVEHDDGRPDTTGMGPLEKWLFKRDERRLEPKIKKLMEKIPGRTSAFEPTILPWEKRNLDKARRHKKFKKQVKYLDDTIQKLKFAKNTKRLNWVINFLMAAWPILLIGLLIIVAIGVIGYIMPWLFPAEDGSTPDSGSPAFGITGNDFHGIRTWYRDDEKARGELTQEYVALLTDNYDLIVGVHTINVDGTEYYVEISVAEDSIPAEDYDYSDLEDLSTNYPELYSYIEGVADKMEVADNGVDLSTTLEESLDNVKYFGFNPLVLAFGGLDDLVEDYIVTHYDFVAKDGTGNVIALEKTEIDEFVSDNIMIFDEEDGLDLDKYIVRTEKIFVKDYLIDGDDKMVDNVAKHDYVGMAFMAKRDVTFTQLSFIASYVNLGFNMTMSNYDINVILPLIEVMTGEDTGVTQYTYKTIIPQTVLEYNYTEIPDDVSLYQLAREDQYADLVKINDDLVYEYDEDEGLVLHFNNPSHEAFICIEFETLWR